jgi:methionyl-tRNA formyltransferase
VVAVITAPDKPQGRGRQLMTSAVKQYAEAQGIPVLQPTNLKAPEFIEELKSFRANLQVVVAFRMLPQVVWDMPRYGTFNLHASLLPDYRGAAPIHWAIINGEKETGVTTFFIRQEIDTGSILLQEKEMIHEYDTTGSLSDRLMKKGAALVLKTVDLIATGEYQLIPQDLSADAPKAPKLFKENCQINWDQNSQQIVNFIRGLNPFPSAWTIIKGTTYKIHAARVLENNVLSGNIGDHRTDGNSYLYFKCRDGAVSITEIQAPGKRKMSIMEFLRGNQL